LPLLDGIFHAQNAAIAIPVLALSVRAGASGDQLSHTFWRLSVSFLAETSPGRSRAPSRWSPSRICSPAGRKSVSLLLPAIGDGDHRIGYAQHC